MYLFFSEEAIEAEAGTEGVPAREWGAEAETENVVGAEGGGKGLFVGMAEDDGVGIREYWNGMIVEFGLE